MPEDTKDISELYDVCPITQLPIEEPVEIDVCHHRFEEKAIAKWTLWEILRTYGDQDGVCANCPVCRAPYKLHNIVPYKISSDKKGRECCGTTCRIS